MDEQTQSLKKFISDRLQGGMTPDEVAGELRQANWDESQIQQAFQAVQAEVMPSAPAKAGQANPVPQANGRQRGRIKTGWLLLKISLRVLKGNKYLLRFFLMTWVSVLLATIGFSLIFWFASSLYDSSSSNGLSALGFVFVFLDYLIVYFAINFYAAALAQNMLDIFAGKRQPYEAYVRAARSKAPAIFVFSLIAATIGMILQFVVERIRYIGWILAWLLGTAWSLGTMFTLPIIMTSEKPSGIGAIKQSAGFFKHTWGENITAKVSVNLPLVLINILVTFLFIGLVGAAAESNLYGLGIFFVFLYLFILLNIAIIGSFANSLVNVALFYYAAYHKVPLAFDAELLNQVFIPKKRRFLKKISRSETPA